MTSLAEVGLQDSEVLGVDYTVIVKVGRSYSTQAELMLDVGKVAGLDDVVGV